MWNNFGWDFLRCFLQDPIHLCISWYYLNLPWHKHIEDQYVEIYNMENCNVDIYNIEIYNMEIYNIENYKCSDPDWVSKERSVLLTD